MAVVMAVAGWERVSRVVVVLGALMAQAADLAVGMAVVWETAAAVAMQLERLGDILGVVEGPVEN